MKLRDSIVLISGASSGIGRALAIAMAQHGVKAVAVMARRAEALEEVAKQIRAAGCQAMVVVADVSVEAQVVAAVREVEAEFGHIDVVVANAGLGDPVSAARPDEATIERVMDINFFGSSRLINAALPAMVGRRSGHIVGVSSLAGYRGMPRGAAYSSSKAALMTLLESYRIELALVGVRVTTVLPGFVDTELVAKNNLKPIMAITATEAAQIIISGIERDRAVLRFPTLTGLLMLMLRTTPAFLFDRIMRRMAHDKLVEALPAPSATPSDPEA